MSKDFVDFAAIKERVGMQDAIAFLNLKLTKREGDQLRFACPACRGGNDRALSVNIEKGAFRCFEDKGKGGTDSIALVAHVKGVRQREAAVMLDQHYPDSKPHRAPSTAQAEPDGRRDVPDALETKHPVIELLGVSAAVLEKLEGGYSARTERIHIPLRLPNGEIVGYFGIATNADQAPLLQFPKDMEERIKPKSHEELRKLLRVV